MKKKMVQKGSKSRVLNQKLTKAEKEILHLLTNEFLTPKKIALRRKTSLTLVYRYIRKLKKKGILNKALKKVQKIQCAFEPSPNQIRLHGNEIHIQILWKDNRYDRLFKKTNIIIIDGNTIRLYNNSIEIYIKESFYADDEHKANAKFIPYLMRFLQRVENDTQTILIKPRSQNIRIVKQHYSHINNGLAKEYEKSGDWIKIYAKEDGKLWFLIDNSFNLHEAETVHTNTSKKDMTKVRTFFNDLRDNELPLPSELTKMIYDVTQNQVMFDRNIKKHFEVLNKIGKAINKLNKRL